MQERKKVINLLRCKHESWHVSMTDLQTLQKRWSQSIDRIASVKIPEGWRGRIVAGVTVAGSMTTRASLLRELLPFSHLTGHVAPGIGCGGG